MIPEDYIAGVLSGNRTILARAITLIESSAPQHADPAEEVLKVLTPYAGRAIRVGITGVPGVGKSTLIEALGCYLCQSGKKVAVLAVDPSSSLSHGSILGDKTRMEMLAREPGCFIRPSPSCGALGGVARKSRQTMLLCEAAGYEVILVETVGVGQSEITVRSMVDFFLVLMLAGAGDELQGIKRGILELADALVITKADGDNIPKARMARAEYDRALHYLTPPTPDWTPKVLTCSSTEGTGVKDLWEMIEEFQRNSLESGALERRRRTQMLDWFQELLEQEVWKEFWRHIEVKQAHEEARRAMIEGKLTPTAAAKLVLSAAKMR